MSPQRDIFGAPGNPKSPGVIATALLADTGGPAPQYPTPGETGVSPSRRIQPGMLQGQTGCGSRGHPKTPVSEASGNPRDRGSAGTGALQETPPGGAGDRDVALPRGSHPLPECPPAPHGEERSPRRASRTRGSRYPPPGVHPAQQPVPGSPGQAALLFLRAPSRERGGPGARLPRGFSRSRGAVPRTLLASPRAASRRGARAPRYRGFPARRTLPGTPGASRW